MLNLINKTMALDEFGFGGGNEDQIDDTTAKGNQDPVTDIDKGKGNDPLAVDDLDDIKDPNKPDNNGEDHKEPDTDDNKNTLEEGTNIEVDGKTYTVDANGNVLDENGQMFKEAKDVDAWIKSFEQVESNDEPTSISISDVQKLMDIEVVDDNDKPIEFENTPEGIKSYIDAVLEIKQEEHYETAINTMFQKYPFIEDLINYYHANGGSIDGFNQVRDLSGISIDESNESQQESIIRTAWKEQNRKGDVNGYIQYLKSSGILYSTAQEELEGLKERDAEYRKEMARKAEEAENARIAQLEQYWGGVKKVIESRNIAGYTIPENITITRNGQKISATPADFFNYVYMQDKNGLSAYQRDLEAQDKTISRDDAILRAYLMFTGGSYSDLVNMAINREKVKTLKLKSQTKQNSSMRITKPKNSKDSKNVDFGY